MHFFSRAHVTFSRTDHIQGHKNFNTFKIEIISSIFSDQNDLKLKFNFMKKNKNNTNIWRLQNIQLKNQRINKEIKLETRNAFKMHKNRNTPFKIYNIQQNQFQEKILQQYRPTSRNLKYFKQTTQIYRGIRKKEQIKPKGRGEIIKSEQK